MYSYLRIYTHCQVLTIRLYLQDDNFMESLCIDHCVSLEYKLKNAAQYISDQAGHQAAIFRSKLYMYYLCNWSTMPRQILS